MKKILVLLFVLFSVSSLGASNLEVKSKAIDCEDYQTEALEFLEIVVAEQIKNIRSQVEERIDSEEDLSTGMILKLRTVLDTLRCSANKLNKLTYRCRKAGEMCKTTTYAWTLPFVGRQVNLCPRFWYMPTIFAAASAVLHEVTHKCGTHDADYFEKGDPPRDAGVLSWAMIADSYYYWGEFGFCIPEIDC